MLDKKSQSHSCGQLLFFFFFCRHSSSVSTELISQRREATVQSSLGNSGQRFRKLHNGGGGCGGLTWGNTGSMLVHTRWRFPELILSFPIRNFEISTWGFISKVICVPQTHVSVRKVQNRMERRHTEVTVDLKWLAKIHTSTNVFTSTPKMRKLHSVNKWHACLPCLFSSLLIAFIIFAYREDKKKEVYICNMLRLHTHFTDRMIWIDTVQLEDLWPRLPVTHTEYSAKPNQFCRNQIEFC